MLEKRYNVTINHFSRYSMLSAAVLCGVLALSGCDKDKEGSAARGPSPVSVVKVTRHDVPADMTWVAKTESSRAVESIVVSTDFWMPESTPKAAW